METLLCVNQQKSRLLLNCRLGTVSYMVGVMLTVGDPTVCKSTEVKITVQLQARDCFIHGSSYAHCWRSYCDCEMKHNNKSAVPLL